MGKFLDKSGVEKLWAKTKGHVATEIGKIDVSGDIADAIKTNVTDKLGAASGIATLGSDSKLTASQLPALKTVNGESIVGSGNIAIDLNIYQIVDSLPESNQNPNKIYLVLTSPATGQEQDVYTEYLWTGTKWEKLGEYKAEVDLADYLKTADLKEEGKKAGLVTFDDVATKDKNGLLPKEVFTGSNNDFNILTGFQLSKYYRDEDSESDGIVLCFTKTRIDRTGYTTHDDMYHFTLPLASDNYNTYHSGLMSKDESSKLKAIAAEATKDEAISSEELDAILV